MVGCVPISSGWAVGLSAWPSTAGLRQKGGVRAPLSVLATRVSERLPKGEGASSAMHNLSQAVYGLAPPGPDDFGTHPDTPFACAFRHPGVYFYRPSLVDHG